jgi:protein-S-isoprenylcysteine O-methyltransferase Ste14
MDAINILLAFNLIVAGAANVKGAKKNFLSALSKPESRPKTYLQKLPLNVAAAILLLTILSVFQIGTIDYGKFPQYFALRLTGLGFYFIFSWFQVWAFRSLGENYSQDIILYKNHSLVTLKAYRFIRHPQYLGQILSDLGAGVALLSYTVIPLAIVEIPLLILRAQEEEKLLSGKFKDEFNNYKKQSGFFIPFL